jgi:hypothetical protein
MSQTSKPESDEMNLEYDIRGGVRGKYYERYRQGTNAVLLEPQREHIAGLLTELEKEHGPIPPELMEEVRRECLAPEGSRPKEGESCAKPSLKPDLG